MGTLTRRARRATTLAVGLLAAWTHVAPVDAADEPAARILIVGDSVTQGYKGDFTWRYFAWRGLASAGEHVDFVGPRSGTFFVHEDGAWDWDYTGEGAYADPDFDRDHGAIYGGRMGPEENWFHHPIGPDVTGSRPDVIMSLWGVNDLGYSDDGPLEVIDIYRDWVTEARSVDPDGDFVLGRLPYEWIDEVPEFNDLLGPLAEELSTERSRIVASPAGMRRRQSAWKYRSSASSVATWSMTLNARLSMNGSSQPRSARTTMRCPELDTGRNSVSPWTSPSTTAWIS